MLLFSKLSLKWADYWATIMGSIIAIAQAWFNIDWSNFDLQKEWPKLGLSAIIAIGGYVSTLKIKSPSQNS